ncbi:MAG TPA: helix-turn-helix domain-containing protein [Fimbriimonadaceae bacterium]|nr:helix-turn-helix domain-containing protein [Fimbriimonadaceae bacterium]
MNLSSLLAGTRGEIVALVREGVSTIGEIADRMELTQNAVRAHVANLEQNGVLVVAGKRASAKRPAIIYALSDAAEAFYARAYAPVLVALAQGLATKLPPKELEFLFEKIGRELVPRSSESDKLLRAETAAQTLTSLGAVVRVEETADGIWIRGKRCPLSSLVAECPQACRLGVGLVQNIVGGEVEEQCTYEPAPACQFLIR